MNPIVRGKVDSAVQSLQEAAPLNVTKAGSMQIAREGIGDVQTMSLDKAKPAGPKKIDGNIDADSFNRLW
jgi:hypothetical protein